MTLDGDMTLLDAHNQFQQQLKSTAYGLEDKRFKKKANIFIGSFTHDEMLERQPLKSKNEIIPIPDISIFEEDKTKKE